MAARYWRHVARAHAARKSRLDVRAEQGFTLIELIVVVAIMPIIVGAFSVGLISVLSLQGSVANRLSDSGDAQVVSGDYQKDVQSAANLTTNTTAQCGSGTQLLGLEWGLNPKTGTYQTVVSYVLVQNSGGLTSSLVRQYCGSGASSTPASSFTISSDVQNTQPPPTIAGPTGSSPSSGWISAAGVANVSFPIEAVASKYSYTLLAIPEASTNSGQQSTVTPPPTSCSFAAPETGTYASSLCFVDFTPYNGSEAPSPCQQISEGIVNTPFTMSFCLSVSGGPVAPASIPTYTNPPTSEAFLGNNGFYTGIPGNPALYQTTEGTTSTVTITNIKVLDANGNPATGWGLVTGDAESTDAGESMTWTSNQDLSLIPNSPSSSIGNACAAPTSPDGLTGVGTTTVECQATVSSDKTGTVMLTAPTPTTLTVHMVGTGLEAMFLGLLLPA
jgi:prepilin-type N-terminal cleavage/methylation domain-containing protein